MPLVPGLFKDREDELAQYRSSVQAIGFTTELISDLDDLDD